eukprot:1021410-Pelagomonas_calceolata.AAC.5
MTAVGAQLCNAHAVAAGQRVPPARHVHIGAWVEVSIGESAALDCSDQKSKIAAPMNSKEELPTSSAGKKQHLPGQHSSSFSFATNLHVRLSCTKIHALISALSSANQAAVVEGGPEQNVLKQHGLHALASPTMNCEPRSLRTTMSWPRFGTQWCTQSA